MLTKKDKLLKRPWIVQKYLQHRQKVLNAEPAIDYYSPPVYSHIQSKYKKTQKEFERKKQIERENVRLLQRLTAIMNTKPLENFWRTPRPNFLNRVYIEYPKRIKPPDTQSASSHKTTHSIAASVNKGASASRCDTCNGKQLLRNNKIGPEERIPFPPPKQSRNVKILNDKSDPHSCCRYCC